MNETDALLERVSTGVPGLDPILEGGLLKGGVYVIQGTPGSGKTILGNQACFHHARQGGSAVYATLLAESHARMVAHMHRMSFFDAAQIPDHVFYISVFKELEASGLDAVQRTLRDAIESRQASLLVLDGLVSVQEASPTDRDFKKFVYGLQTVAAMTGCIILLLTSLERPHASHADHTVVDGVIEVSHELQGLKAVRHVQVLKLRGTDPILGRHTVTITHDGLVVSRRVETQLHLRPDTRAVAGTRERLRIGVPELDRMLSGGLPERSITMILGPSGAGKTILGLHFLVEGTRVGEPAVYFGFYEKPHAILQKSQGLATPLRAAVDAGLMQILWQPRAEGVIDLLGQRLLNAVRQTKARRLFIDGVEGFLSAAEYPDRVRDVLSVVTDQLEEEGVTSVYTAETRDLFGPRIEVPMTGVSAITHNILLLRHVELKAQLYRLVSILKLRDSNYDSGIREFRIDDDGIRVSDTFGTADQILSGMAYASPVPRSEPRAPGQERRLRERRVGDQ
jgi:circadian clock protein KaiC